MTSALVSLIAFFCFDHSFGQGTLRFTFDGQPAGTAVYIQQYYESGMWFRPLGVVGPGNGFVRQGGSYSLYPENGSTYLQAGLGDSLMCSFLDGRLFDLISVDLAEYSTTVPYAVTVPFVGYRLDGSTVTINFTTDGIIDGTGPVADFQTFYFGPQFSGLTRVEIPTYGWSLDNLVVAVPEPASCGLLVLGCLAFWFARSNVTPNQSAAANRRPAGQSDGSDNLSAIVAADRAFPAAVAELGR